MGFICLLDVGLEYLGLIPNWRRRQFLMLDEFIRLIYSKQELWYSQVTDFAFKPEFMQNEMTVDDLY